MKAQSTDRTGVLNVRLWNEANHENGLRTRITQTLDPMVAGGSFAVPGAADDICASVTLSAMGTRSQ